MPGSVDVVDRWGKYVEGGSIRVGGKEWGIVYIMCHHESDSAWLVLKSNLADGMYEYDIDYDQGLPF
jgi:hypothetical protein